LGPAEVARLPTYLQSRFLDPSPGAIQQAPFHSAGKGGIYAPSTDRGNRIRGLREAGYQERVNPVAGADLDGLGTLTVDRPGECQKPLGIELANGEELTRQVD